MSTNSYPLLSTYTIRTLEAIYRTAAWKTRDLIGRRLFNQHQLRLYSGRNMDLKLAEAVTELLWENARNISTAKVAQHPDQVQLRPQSGAMEKIIFVPELVAIEIGSDPLGAYEYKTVKLKSEELVNFSQSESTNGQILFTRPASQTESIESSNRFAFVNSFGQLVDGRVQVPFGNRYDVKFWVPAFVAPQIRFQNTEAEEDAADVEIPQCHTAEVAIVATEQRLSVPMNIIFHMGAGQIAQLDGVWTGIAITQPVVDRELTNLWFC